MNRTKNKNKKSIIDISKIKRYGLYYRIYLNILIIIIPFVTGYSHDNEVVHPFVTMNAVQFLNVQEVNNYTWFSGGVPSPQCSYINEGSVKEDFANVLYPGWDIFLWGINECGLVGLNWTFHGYNPVTEAGWLNFSFIDAVSYGQGIWLDAEQLYNNGNLQSAYFKLGRVCHLLEDMSSPAHTHTDFHGGGDDFEDWGKLNYLSGSYNASTIRRPSTHGYIEYSTNSYENFMKNLAWQTYLATTYQGKLLREFPPIEQPDSELKRMFSGPDELRYEHDWFDGDYWVIDEVGWFFDATTSIGNSEWWLCEGNETNGTGYYYLENLDQDGDGNPTFTNPGVYIVPDVKRVNFFERINDGDNLDLELTTNTDQLVQIYASNLYPRATEWVAGLLQYFYDPTPPFVTTEISHYSTTNTDIIVDFSEDMDQSTFTNSNIIVSGSSTGIHACSFIYDDINFELTINPDTDFGYGETVTITITTSVTDLAKNGIDGDQDGNEGPNYEESFDLISIMTANFIADNTLVNVPALVNFTDISTPNAIPINSWEWDFDNDGNIDSYEQNPTRFFGTPGNYTITLSISDGYYSDSETKVDYITVLPEILPNTALIEYFFDSDPGFGNGTAIPITSAPIVTVQANIDVSGLSTGLHRLYVRAQDDNGNWGIPQAKSVLIQSTDVNDPLPNVSQLEYFFDSDPGSGSGTQLSFTPATNVNITENLNLLSIETGLHRLYVRAMDDNSNWGIPQTKSVLVQQSSVNDQLPLITEIEYFFDTDPGLSLGQSLTFTPDSVVEIADNLPLDTLSIGDHSVYFRAKDANNIWGIPQFHQFSIMDSIVYTDQNIAVLATPLTFNDGTTNPGDGHTIEMLFSDLSGSGNVFVEQTNQIPANLFSNLCIDVVWNLIHDPGITAFITDVTFHYNDIDLIGVVEDSLLPAYYDTLLTSWTTLTDFTLDVINNTITIHNLDHFTDFALGESGAFTEAVVLADLTVFLQGPYSSGTMNTYLQSNALLPLTQPYSSSPWNYAGTESVGSVPSGVVDWILVELRTGTDAATMVSQRACFVLSDGSVVDTDGVSPLSFKEITDGDYYVVIFHRNHLAIMSALPVTLSSSEANSYDFTTSSDNYYGGASVACEIETDVWGMWSGDINHDGEITTSDYTLWYNSARVGASGYLETDINYDSQVTTSDYTIWYNNARVGASSGVPEGTTILVKNLKTKKAIPKDNTKVNKTKTIKKSSKEKPKKNPKVKKSKKDNHSSY